MPNFASAPVRSLSDKDTWRQRLRQAMLSGRMALTAETQLRLSIRIVGHLHRSLPELAQTTIGFCWPIRNEPDIRPAVVSWLEQGAKAAMPVVVRPNQPLLFRSWRTNSSMTIDSQGIPIPSDGEWVVPSALLIPVVAFDDQGYRLGYGGGYFDRTLAAWQPRPLVIGIGYEFNRVSTIKPEAHDQPMDWVVTETGARQVGLWAEG